MDKDQHIHDNAEEIAQIKAQLDSETAEHPTVVTHQVYRVNPLREDRLHTLLDLEGSLREIGLWPPARMVAERGASVLLVDDVYTTGSTICAATQSLIDSGAARVNVLTIARVGNH